MGPWHLVLLGTAIGAAASPQPQAAPDVILSNGKVITVDERFTIVQAIAVRGERILAVGGSRQIGGPRVRYTGGRSEASTPHLASPRAS